MLFRSQTTWLRLIETIERYDERRSFEAWMFSVAHNLAIDHLRRQRSISLDEPADAGESAASRLPASASKALHLLIESERAERLAIVVAELPGIHRTILTLRFEEDMMLSEIAEVTGLPLSTEKSRLARALESLRGRLG